MKNIFLLFITLTFWLAPATSHAQTSNLTKYKLLEPIPTDASGGLKEELTAEDYFGLVFRFALSIASVLAVIRLIYAGIIYMSTDAYTGKSEAKKIIQEALLGLGLALSAWVIVATILPPTSAGVFEYSLSLDKPNISTSAPDLNGGGGPNCSNCRPGYVMTAEQIINDQNIRNDLRNFNPTITVNNGPCKTGGTTGCTNVNDLAPGAISGIKNLATSCRSSSGSACDIVITGGTEGGHADHNGYTLDLRPTDSLNKYLAKTNPDALNPRNKTVVSIGSVKYTYEETGANGRATAPHWHVNF